MNVLGRTTCVSPAGASTRPEEVQRLIHELQWVFADARRRHTPEGVTLAEAQWFRSVLITIARNPDITINEIARQVNAPKSRVSVLVSQLAERDIVRRDPDARDRRLVHVTLTEQGTAWLGRLRDHYQEAFARMLSPLGAEQLDSIIHGLELLLSVLRPALEEPSFLTKEEQPAW